MKEIENKSVWMKLSEEKIINFTQTKVSKIVELLQDHALKPEEVFRPTMDTNEDEFPFIVAGYEIGFYLEKLSFNKRNLVLSASASPLDSYKNPEFLLEFCQRFEDQTNLKAKPEVKKDEEDFSNCTGFKIIFEFDEAEVTALL